MLIAGLCCLVLGLKKILNPSIDILGFDYWEVCTRTTRQERQQQISYVNSLQLHYTGIFPIYNRPPKKKEEFHSGLLEVIGNPIHSVIHHYYQKMMTRLLSDQDIHHVLICNVIIQEACIGIKSITVK